MIYERCYISIIGHSQENKSSIATGVAKLLNGWFTGQIRYGYNPDSIEVHMSRSFPATEGFELIERIENFIKDNFEDKHIQVSIEIS